MKRFIFGLMTVALILIMHGNLAYASVNDFIVRDFQADYYLDKDNNGHSTLKTVESITAEFPDYDQNHGIERALASTYDGHSTNLKIQSITDQNNQKIPYTTRWQNDNLILRLGDKDTFAHGIKTYVIKYSQQNVTRFFDDTGRDEFYWDTNGTGWLQPFDKLTARLHVGSGLADMLSGDQFCYFGVAGSTNECAIHRSSDVFTMGVTSISVGENLTFAFGFKPHTFTAYQMSLGDFIERYVTFISAALGFIVVLAIAVLRLTKGKSAPGRGTIIAEYLPPRNVDVALSSIILNKSSSWAAATYIDLAVRHKIRIIEREKNVYSLEFITSEGLTNTEASVIKALFGEVPKVGDRYDIDKNKTNSKLMLKLMSIYRLLGRWARNQGYYAINNKLRTVMIGLILFIAAQTLIAWLIFIDSTALFIEYLPYVGAILIIIGFIILGTMKPLSTKGRQLFDYLKGLELYIKIAEEDRIRVLQSPEGANRTPIDTNNKAMLVRLYERVLPYAVLFGNEKEWALVLGTYYEDQKTTPDWYVGNNIFNAVLFTNSLSDFSTRATNNSYATSSSSSIGGSGGGGFSGGGGGGGGGGGW